MDEKLEQAIVEVLKQQGYTNVESNFGTIWYTDEDGTTWSLCPVLCD